MGRRFESCRAHQRSIAWKPPGNSLAFAPEPTHPFPRDRGWGVWEKSSIAPSRLLHFPICTYGLPPWALICRRLAALDSGITSLQVRKSGSPAHSATPRTRMPAATQSRSLFVLEGLFRVVNVVGFDDQRDGNVLTVRPRLSHVLL